MIVEMICSTVSTVSSTLSWFTCASACAYKYLMHTYLRGFGLSENSMPSSIPIQGRDFNRTANLTNFDLDTPCYRGFLSKLFSNSGYVDESHVLWMKTRWHASFLRYPRAARKSFCSPEMNALEMIRIRAFFSNFRSIKCVYLFER